jgi:hypothetical protein
MGQGNNDSDVGGDVVGSRRETKGNEEKGMMAVAEDKGTTMEGKMLREAERRR